MLKRNGFLFLASIVLFAITVAPALAHKHPCGHRHQKPFEDSLIKCTNPNAACVQGGKNGTCKQKQNFSRAWCECVVPDEGCTSSQTQDFDPETLGMIPQEGDLITYTAAFSAGNGIVVYAEGQDVTDLLDQESPIQGNFKLYFGSFEDPTNIPVTVLEADLVVGSFPVLGIQTGLNHINLLDGAPITLSYNLDSGKIEPIEESVTLGLTNDMTSNLEVTLYFEARLLDDGRITSYGQSVSSSVLPDAEPMPIGEVGTLLDQ